MKIVKAGCLAASLFGVAVAGDYYNVCDRVVYPVVYNEELVEEGFYKQPFKLRKEYRINEDGFLEVYFGDKKMYPVLEGMRVNERGLVERIRDDAKGALKAGGKKIGDLLESLKSLGHEFYGGITDE